MVFRAHTDSHFHALPQIYLLNLWLFFCLVPCSTALTIQTFSSSLSSIAPRRAAHKERGLGAQRNQSWSERQNSKPESSHIAGPRECVSFIFLRRIETWVRLSLENQSDVSTPLTSSFKNIPEAGLLLRPPHVGLPPCSVRSSTHPLAVLTLLPPAFLITGPGSMGLLRSFQFLCKIQGSRFFWESIKWGFCCFFHIGNSQNR